MCVCKQTYVIPHLFLCFRAHEALKHEHNEFVLQKSQARAGEERAGAAGKGEEGEGKEGEGRRGGTAEEAPGGAAGQTEGGGGEAGTGAPPSGTGKSTRRGEEKKKR